jgi:cyclophilin family peptidyl-prolyl cis-trans isomerase
MKLAGTIALLLFAQLAWAAASPAGEPEVARERIVFTTDYGHLVFALYPAVAPKHVAQLLKLTQLGAYESTHAYRIIPNFIVQFADVKNRLHPLNAEQYEADRKIPGEFSTTLRHAKGVLSMARWDDPDSATSSFSILLADAPHLDGKYTIFGRLESGGTTVNKILGVPRNGESPKAKIVVRSALVVHDIDAWYQTHPRDPPETIGAPIPQKLPEEASATSGDAENPPGSLDWLAYLVATVLFISVMTFFLYERLDKRQLLSLHMLNGLIAAFVLFIVMVPVGHAQPWVAGLLFIALPALFKFMNRFESSK